MKTNYHTHIYRCGHAVGDVEDYIKEAIDNYFDVIGISDHGPLPDYLNDRMAMDELGDYYGSILNAQEKYGDKIKILSALELEYFPEFSDYYTELKKKYDYLILGAHWFIDEGKLISGFSVKNKRELNIYVEKSIEAMESGFFSFMAHPDIFMIFYPNWDEDTIEVSRRICEKAKELNMPIELNANGVRKGLHETANGLRYRYPREEFWRIASEVGVKVLVGSDCHYVEELDDDSYKLAKQLAKEWKLNVVERY